LKKGYCMKCKDRPSCVELCPEAEAYAAQDHVGTTVRVQADGEDRYIKMVYYEHELSGGELINYKTRIG